MVHTHACACTRTLARARTCQKSEARTHTQHMHARTQIHLRTHTHAHLPQVQQRHRISRAGLEHSHACVPRREGKQLALRARMRALSRMHARVPAGMWALCPRTAASAQQLPRAFDRHGACAHASARRNGCCIGCCTPPMAARRAAQWQWWWQWCGAWRCREPAFESVVLQARTHSHSTPPAAAGPGPHGPGGWQGPGVLGRAAALGARAAPVRKHAVGAACKVARCCCCCRGSVEQWQWWRNGTEQKLSAANTERGNSHTGNPVAAAAMQQQQGSGGILAQGTQEDRGEDARLVRRPNSAPGPHARPTAAARSL